jgi:hypothetical protein
MAEIPGISEGMCRMHTESSSDWLVKNLAQAWLAHEQQVGELRERAELSERLLHDLTPMGSEFVGQPEKCAKWIEAHG